MTFSNFFRGFAFLKWAIRSDLLGLVGLTWTGSWSSHHLLLHLHDVRIPLSKSEMHTPTLQVLLPYLTSQLSGETLTYDFCIHGDQTAFWPFQIAEYVFVIFMSIELNLKIMADGLFFLPDCCHQGLWWCNGHIYISCKSSVNSLNTKWNDFAKLPSFLGIRVRYVSHRGSAAMTEFLSRVTVY